MSRADLEAIIMAHEAEAITGSGGAAPRRGGGLFGRLSGADKFAAAIEPSETKPIAGNAPAQLLAAYEASGQGWFWATDANGNLTYVSPAVAAKFAAQGAQLLGQPINSLFAEDQSSDAVPGGQRSLPFLLARKSRFDGLVLRARFAEESVWWQLSAQPQHDAVGNFIGFCGNGTDVSDKQQSNEENQRLTKYDTLTGLVNRYRMSQLLGSTMAAFKVQNRPVAVMLLDLDRFKQVNDTLGHPAGDALLQQVAGRLIKVIGDRERVCRLGGDEFQILLPDLDDRGKLGDIASDIIASLSQPYSVNGSRCIIGASVGIAISPFDGDSAEALIRNADLALYAAKSGGRGRFKFFSEELLNAAENRRALEEDLVDAVAAGQLRAFYQPLVCAKTHVVQGCEALLRWEHPERGMVSPALFIPIAEDTDLIKRLGEWVLRQACADAAQWPGKMRVAVNVSPVQFMDPALTKIILSALANSGLEADRLELEITESVFLNDSKETDEIFKRLKGLGVRLALDDFGTGYSSLSYLKSAPFDKIKIDQSFVRGMTDPGSRNQAIITAIVALSEALEMETTAEGIESLDQLAMIQALGVSQIQGFVYSEAIPDASLTAAVADGSWVIEPTGPPRQRHPRISMFRRAGAIHENHYYPMIIRNLSKSGALIEGIMDVPIGTQFVIDFGEGQLAVSTVRRSHIMQQGVEFEELLVDDGDGGLCTRHRVPSYLLAQAGLPTGGMASREDIMRRLDASKGGLPTFRTTSGLQMPL